MTPEQLRELIESLRNGSPLPTDDAIALAIAHAAALEELAMVKDELLGVKEYREKNPLGGPAKVFDAMADRIRAGDDFNKVIADYGWCQVDRAERAEAALAECRAKLEVDPRTKYDGIDCRDETIRMLEQKCERLVTDNGKLNAALNNARSMFAAGCSYTKDGDPEFFCGNIEEFFSALSANVESADSSDEIERLKHDLTRATETGAEPATRAERAESALAEAGRNGERLKFHAEAMDDMLEEASSGFIPEGNREMNCPECGKDQERVRTHYDGCHAIHPDCAAYKAGYESGLREAAAIVMRKDNGGLTDQDAILAAIGDGK